MQQLKNDLAIDETFTKEVRTRKKVDKFNSVKENIPLIPDYNYMADLIHFPSFNGYKYLLVVVDLATDEFDFEPIKEVNSTQALKAFKKITDRGTYIKTPKASLTTDGGPEFKGVFDDYLFDESIFHKTTSRGRHKQLANVDNLIHTLSRLINGYMNAREEKTGKVCKDWLAPLPKIKTQLNRIRRKTTPANIKTYEYDVFDPVSEVISEKGKVKNILVKPKYKVGDNVYYQLDHPRNALDKPQPSGQFRSGDYTWSRIPKKIKELLYFPQPVNYRYIVEGMPNVSFVEQELRRA